MFIFCVPILDSNDSGNDSSNSPRHGGVASSESRPQPMVWDILGDKLKEKKPKNLQELEKMLQEKWKKICVLDIQNLINSTPRRVAAVCALQKRSPR